MSGVLNLLLAGAASAIKDAYYNLTTLLLNTSSTNGAQNNTFLDSSTNNFTITRNGNTTQGTFTPFSQTGWSYNGTAGAYCQLNNADYSLGTGDFTVETWMYCVDDSTYSYANICSAPSNPNFTVGFGAGGGSGARQFYVEYGGSATSFGSNMSGYLNRWTHIAVVRQSGTVTAYQNGVSLGSVSKSASVGSTANLYLLRNSGDANMDFRGYISNYRITKAAVYSSNFTPSAQPLTVLPNTVMLTFQDNRFVDNSALRATVTPAGTASVQAFSPFAPGVEYSTSVVGGSAYFDGSGDNLTLPSGAAFAVGTGDFTVETWIYITSTASQYIIDARNASQTSTWYFLTNPATNNITFEALGVSAKPTLYSWNHLVYCRSGTTGSIFLNGARVGTHTNSTNYSTSPTTSYVASRFSSDEYFNGYIGGLRVVKGTAVYDPTQTTCTVPTAPLTAITNTTFLLNATNSGIFDSAAKNVLETVGNAQVSTTQSKWGTTSMYFDGTGDLLLIPNNQMLNLNADFTIEFWIYLNSTSGEQCIFHNHNSDNNGVFVSVNGGGAGKIRLGAGNGSSFYVLIDSSTAISASTWTYVACTRSGSTWTVYINGTSVGTATSASNPTFSTSDLIQVGRFSSGAPNALNAYIDDLRITKYARTITASPSAAFPLQ